MEPKSVCFPSAVLRSEGGCGGALIRRIWSPAGAVRRCRDCNLPAGRWRCVFKCSRIVVTKA